MERTIPAFAFPAEAGPHSPILEGWKGRVGLGTTTMSKQSRPERYVMEITIVSASEVTTLRRYTNLFFRTSRLINKTTQEQKKTPK